MGSASLIQLSAVGVENVDLTVDADTTFWKSVYSKHTGFSMEPKDLSFTSGVADYGKKATVRIDRQGDMLADMWLVVEVEQLTKGGGGGQQHFTNDFGRAFIEQVQVIIGGVVYDVRIGEYMHLEEEITTPDELMLNKLTGKSETLFDLRTWSGQVQRFYIPITFWFTNTYNNALPLVALYQHEVQIEFTFRKFVDMVVNSTGLPVDDPVSPAIDGGAISVIQLMCEYVFLENNERNFFARGTHKYMIEQVQFVGATSVTSGISQLSVDLHFNHPTAELVWVFRDTDNLASKDYFNFQGEEVPPYENDAFQSLTLLLNSSQRWTPRDPLYFKKVTMKRTHTRIPRKEIYSFPFALHPESSGTDPSGNINFSRIDNSQMVFKFGTPDPLLKSYDLLIFARSVNWAKIERGLAKLFYA